jgi:hypothetical protein
MALLKQLLGYTSGFTPEVLAAEDSRADAKEATHENGLVTLLSADQMPASRKVAKSISKGVTRELRDLEDLPSDVLAGDCQGRRGSDGNDIVPHSDAIYSIERPPPTDAKILLHSCCAPCSGAMFEEMVSQKFDVTIFFYNPNIHPRKEYEIRKNENKRYAEKHGVPFVDCDYDSQSWFQRMEGLELDPERGQRCVACFDMRMEVTAAYALENGFHAFTTTNATSRWKDESQVNGAGVAAANKILRGHRERDDVNGTVLPRYWIYDWQTDAMTKRKYEISVEDHFYKQEYCGCSYSLRDSNTWRKQQGIPKVRIGGDTAGLGTRYFEDAVADAEEESQEVVDAFFTDANNGFDDPARLEKVYEGRKKNNGTADDNNW